MQVKLRFYTVVHYMCGQLDTVCNNTKKVFYIGRGDGFLQGSGKCEGDQLCYTGQCDHRGELPHTQFSYQRWMYHWFKRATQGLSSK